MLIEWYLWGNLPNFFEEDNEDVFSEKDVTELNSSMSNMQNSNTEAKESEEDY